VTSKRKSDFRFCHWRKIQTSQVRSHTTGYNCKQVFVQKGGSLVHFHARFTTEEGRRVSSLKRFRNAQRFSATSDTIARSTSRRDQVRLEI